MDTIIQLANCTYTYKQLIKYLLDKNEHDDKCLSDLIQNKDMLLAVKFDLILHQYVHESMDLTEFVMLMDNPQKARSIFYASYSGLAFHQAVSYQGRPYLFETEAEANGLSFEKRYYMESVEFSDYVKTVFQLNTPIIHYRLNEQPRYR